MAASAGEHTVRAPRGEGSAVRRRAQRVRQTARHVRWLVDLQRDERSHHTAPSKATEADRLSGLEAQVRAQRALIDGLVLKLGELEEQLSAAAAAQASTRGFSQQQAEQQAAKAESEGAPGRSRPLRPGAHPTAVPHGGGGGETHTAPEGGGTPSETPSRTANGALLYVEPDSEVHLVPEGEAVEEVGAQHFDGSVGMAADLLAEVLAEAGITREAWSSARVWA